MHKGKGEEVLHASLIGVTSGRGKGSMKVSRILFPGQRGPHKIQAKYIRGFNNF